MRRLLIASLVACGTLWQTLPALGASPTACLGTDPVAAADPARLRAVREAVDATCPCVSFNGALGQSRSDYVACAKAVLKSALLGGQLRNQCRGAATYPVSRSTCGHGPLKPKVPCIKTSKSGKVSCKISSPAACERAQNAACSAYTNCLDAADTNHDSKVALGDSGACNPLVTCLKPPLPDGTACNDGVACTKNDACSGHVCGGIPYTCDAPGTCQEATGSCNGDGTCTFPAKPDGTTCDQGVDVRPPLVCTGGTCGACAVSGTCSTTAVRSCVVDGHCPFGETCVAETSPAPTPRFTDNRDGTITDRETCLVWEKKGAYDGTPVTCPGGSSCGDPHDADNVYVWSNSPYSRPDGPAFTAFLAGLNTSTFAGHTNWRLPIEHGVETPFTAPKELESILAAAAPGCGSGAPCTLAAFQTSCTAACEPSDATCSCTAPVATWTGSASGYDSTWSIDFATATANAVGQAAAGATRAVRGGLPYLDCGEQSREFQRALDDLTIACFEGCTNPQTFQECLVGCSAGGGTLEGLRTTAAETCATDPGAMTCDAYRAPLDAWVAAAPNPPLTCVNQCNDPICEAKCTMVGTSGPGVVQRLYDACLATNR